MAPKKSKGPPFAVGTAGKEKFPGKDKTQNAVEASERDKGGGKDKAKATSPPAEAKPFEKDPGHIEMKPFQRLPKEILHNYCQKHKMSKPHYELRSASRGSFKTECILSNPKDSSKTMKFLTNEEFPFKRHSENFSALLALHHLEPTRPYEKLFPSPFREAWLSLSGESPQRQEPQDQQGSGCAKRQSAKAKTSKGAACSPTSAGLPTTLAPVPSAVPVAAASAPPLAPPPLPADSAKVSGSGPPNQSLARACTVSATVTPNSTLPVGKPNASSGVAAATSSLAATLPVQISSAHKFASEFERQQAAETRRLEEVKREKQKEIQRLEEEAQMPTVFMAEAVRKKVANVLRDILPYAAAASSPAATAAAAAAAREHGNPGSPPLLPLQWSDTKWTASICWSLRRQINTPRALGALKTKLLRELTGPLQFERVIASLAVESCLAVLLERQQQQQQQQQQQLQPEVAAFEQVLESCQDFIAINTTDETTLPHHFSPAGKQIEIRCHPGSSQQQQQGVEERGTETALKVAKERLRRALMIIKEGEPVEGPVGETLQELIKALWSLCCSTGLYGIAAAALEQLDESVARVAAMSQAVAAVASVAAAVVGATEDEETGEILQRLGGPQLLTDAEVLQRSEAIKQQELEAAKTLLPDSVFVRLRGAPLGVSSGVPVGFYLRMPVDPPTACSIESCLKASLGVEQLQGAFHGALKGETPAVTLHILSPPGAPYPLQAPVVWVSSGDTSGACSLKSENLSPYGDDMGAILCGTFAAHNAIRLCRPLQQLWESVECRHQAPPPAAKTLGILSSVTCETSLAEITALLQAAWQFEALLDDMFAKNPEGLRGMHRRWLAAIAGGPTPSRTPATTPAVEGTETTNNRVERREAARSPQRQLGCGKRAREGVPATTNCRDPHSGGQSTRCPQGGLLLEMENLSAADMRLCKDIIDSVKHPASAAAMELPVRQHFDAVREFIRNSQRQVLVVQGETGCGKTTQLPRMLLEAAAEAALEQQKSSRSRNSKEACPAYIVCTQPRRLAAVSVANRVAAEMGVSVGGLVGYHVRLQAKSSPHTRLLFCTHGVLLRQILSNNVLDRVTVVMVDEVHERCTEVDLLLLVLSKALARNKPKLKVVVMSASLAVEHFVAYFRPERLVTLRASISSSATTWQQHRQQQLLLWQQQESLRENADRVCSSVMTLKVPGRTFPVSVHFLSEVLKMCDPASLPAPYQGEAARAAAVAARYRGSRPLAAKTEWRDQQHDIFTESSLTSCSTSAAAAAAAAAAGSPAVALPQLPQLVAAVVRHIHLTGAPCVASSQGGPPRGPRGGKRRPPQLDGKGTAIIVFCSGMGEVSAVCRALEELQMNLWILPCHASLHPTQQQKVFGVPPSGLRKVVVATNIAETSITIADVGYVVDCGTHKVLRYDPVKRSSRLQEELITQANAQQRAGRAGRVAEGQCYRLYERDEFEQMQPMETPELHRQALDNVCLQLKAIFPDEPLHHLFSQCLDPPAQDHIDASIRLLIQLGALEVPPSSSGESLTSLGFYLSNFPMNIAFAKMLILAAPLGCLEETIALCALMAADSELYVSGADAAAERQKHFARSQSDFVTNVKVFSAWQAAAVAGRREEENFCSKFGVNANSMQTAEELRRRFRRVAKDVGLMDIMGTAKQTHKRLRDTDAQSSCSTAATRVKGEDCDSDGGEEEVTLRVDDGCSPSLLRGSSSGSTPAKDEEVRVEARDSVRSIFWYIKACVVGGLYPQVATIQAPRTYLTVGSGTVEKSPEPWQMKFFTRVDRDPSSTEDEYFKRYQKQRLQRVFIHPSSVNFQTCEYDTQWVAYLDKIQTSKVFIKDVSTVSVFALLLLSCCDIGRSGGEGTVWLDGWLKLKCAGLISSYVKHLKGLFNLFLNEFFDLSIFALDNRDTHHGNPNYDTLAHTIRDREAPAFVFFGDPEAVGRRNTLTALVKRLVELEGHLL